MKYSQFSTDPKIELRPDAKINFSSSSHLTPEKVDKVGLLVAEQVDEHLVLHLRERDPDGGPGQTGCQVLRGFEGA